jgi:hypothetical protein
VPLADDVTQPRGVSTAVAESWWSSSPRKFRRQRDPCQSMALVIGALVFSVHMSAQGRPPSVAGTWRLTGSTDSAHVQSGPPEASGHRSGGVVDAAIAGLGIESSRLQRVKEVARGIIDTPVRLSIVQTDSMVIVTASNGYTMRLSPGGRAIRDESNGVVMRTRWHQDVLVTEITGIAYDKIVEAYSTDADHRLHVVVKLPLKRRARTPEIHRIYEPVDNR